jgi:hypothetical protein
VQILEDHDRGEQAQLAHERRRDLVGQRSPPDHLLKVAAGDLGDVDERP